MSKKIIGCLITTIQGTLRVEHATDFFSFDNFRIEEYR